MELEQAGTVGVLALQGDVREHESAFRRLGVATRRVRRPADLEGVDGIVLPGGESTTLSMLLDSSGLFEPLATALDEGLPVFGTCAGMILLAQRVEDGRADQRSLGVLDCTVRRNGYGAQRFSFEALVHPTGERLGKELHGVFIRAPVVVEVGPDVEVLATEEPNGRGHPVVLRAGNVLAASFHPELTDELCLHELFATMARPRMRQDR